MPCYKPEIMLTLWRVCDAATNLLSVININYFLSCCYCYAVFQLIVRYCAVNDDGCIFSCSSCLLIEFILMAISSLYSRSNCILSIALDLHAHYYSLVVAA